MKNEDYQLLDSGEQQKLERFGPVTLARPSSGALWKKQHPASLWKTANASFSREEGKNWQHNHSIPSHWNVTLQGLKFKLSLTDFGHVGLFPEHSELWPTMQRALKTRTSPSVLNLFAYSGGATLAAAQAGAKVCHLDASQGMVTWARENAALNNLSSSPIRWIVDDVFKFLKREVKRGNRYDAIILDPPSFGRGSSGQLFKIEEHIHPLLDLCTSLLTPNPLFLLLTTHTPGMTPLVLNHILSQKFKKGHVTTGELTLPSSQSFPLPSGSFARWEA